MALSGELDGHPTLVHLFSAALFVGLSLIVLSLVLTVIASIGPLPDDQRLTNG